MEKTVQNIPFLRITIALAVGIIIGINTFFKFPLILIALVVILILLLIFNANYRYSYNPIFGLGIQLSFILLGIFVTQHYNKKPVLYNQGDFIAVVLEKPQEKPNSYKSLIQIETVCLVDSIIPAKEQAIAYFAKDNSVNDLKAGDVILFKTQLQQIENKNNPYEFDYKKYLERKKIYRQVYLPANKWIKTDKTKKSPGILAEQIRETLLQIYRNQPIDETELEILSALTLGYKRELDPETKRVFSASGASHILAVSGLHVGIIFLVITLLFGFLRSQKRGRLFFVLITISILWIYAFITGLSPSVMRASTMFSIFVIGENIQRKSNIYNSLFASAFILLLINPNNLFDVGFQLSYTAVFGIIFLQPKLERLIDVKSKFFKFFWSLITVSIAVQIATFPITSYYFGQFPTYFWITNTFVIPAVMILIPLGILLLLVSKIHILSNLLAILLNGIIKFTYFLLSLIDQLPLSIFEVLVSNLQLILLVIIVISSFVYIKNQRVFYIKTTLFIIFAFMLSILATRIQRLNQTELIVYNTGKNPTIHLIHGKENYIISEEKIEYEDIYYFPGNITQRKLKLNPPIFILSKDSINKHNLLMKNGLIIFENKSMSFNKKLTDLNTNKMPDFVINPSINDINTIDFETNRVIFTNNSSFTVDSTKSKKIHWINTKGAFRNNW